MNNDDQIEYWNGVAGERWAQLHDLTDRMMGQITQAFLAFADARPGMRVLDIGCGCGTTTLTFALQVQPAGNAAGIDISAPMLAVARARAHAANADVPFLEADAATYEFQPVFDRVVSRFGVMFFADPAAAFANIRAALAPGGKLAFVCWRSSEENVWASLPMAAARQFLPALEPADPLAPGPFAFADRNRIETILTDAGYSNIRIEPFDGTADIGVTAEDAARQSLVIGPLARAAADVDDVTRARIKGAVANAFARYVTSDGVRPPAACWMVKAE